MRNDKWKCSGVLLLGRSLRGGRRLNVALIAAILFRARTRRPFLRRLLKQVRCPALRAGLSHGLVPINDFALRIFRTTVERFAALSFLNQQFAFASRPRTRDAGRLALDVFTLRIVRARDELAVASPALHQLRPIHRTLLVNRLWWFRDRPALGNLPNVAAFRIAAASIEWSKAAAFQLHLLAAKLARLNLFRFRSISRSRRRTRGPIRSCNRLRIARRAAI